MFPVEGPNPTRKSPISVEELPLMRTKSAIDELHRRHQYGRLGRIHVVLLLKRTKVVYRGE